MAYHQYAVGKAVTNPDEPEWTVVEWQDRCLPVRANDAFTAEEAAGAYSCYRVTTPCHHR
ncbi:hypothetical protein GCM10009785_13380 [Brooklawnia cerclae]|uniref:Uncharacterized protein n=1 Tax=Brooklawnia cerclae TaxID=349934 RepID=A0ABX0SN62_9ACTN|nr:hypothetical protein [Brooklawnia cerclae]